MLTRDKAFWWEGVWFFARVAIGVLLGLVQVGTGRVVVLLGLFVASGAVVLGLRPYEARVVNIVTAMGLLVAGISLVLALAYNAVLGTVVFVVIIMLVLVTIFGAFLATPSAAKSPLVRSIFFNLFYFIVFVLPCLNLPSNGRGMLVQKW